MNKILYVFSDQSNSQNITTHLQKLPFTLFFADNISTALSLLYQESPDIIIAESVLWHIDGYGLCHFLKEDPFLRNIPFILLTDPDGSAPINSIMNQANYIFTRSGDLDRLTVKIQFLMAELPSTDHFIPAISESDRQQMINHPEEYIISSLVRSDIITENIITLSGQALHLADFVNNLQKLILTFVPFSAFMIFLPRPKRSILLSSNLTNAQIDNFKSTILSDFDEFLENVSWQNLGLIEAPDLLGSNRDIEFYPIDQADPLQGLFVLESTPEILGSHHTKQIMYKVGSIIQPIIALFMQKDLSEQLKVEFSSTVIHDLRAPLNTIQGYNELLIEKVFGDMPDEQANVCKTIRDSCIKINTLIDDLVDVFKIESGKIDLKLTFFNYLDLLADQLNNIQLIAGKKNITLCLEKHNALISVRADYKRLEQVISNLLSNAMKFTPEGGTITIKVEVDQERKWLTTRVIDTGSGVSVKHMPYIFDMSQKSQRNHVTTHSGTGLGLVICKHIIQSHGGDIGVQSIEGEGATFHFTLPLQTQPRIMIVDDNKEQVDHLATMLRQEEYFIYVTYTGQDAIRIAQQFKPDLLITDINLPEMNGYEIIGRLKGHILTAGIPVIICSAFPVDDTSLEGNNFPYLPKPIDFSKLLDLIAHSLKI